MEKEKQLLRKIEKQIDRDIKTMDFKNADSVFKLAVDLQNRDYLMRRLNK